MKGHVVKINAFKRFGGVMVKKIAKMEPMRAVAVC